MKSNSSCILPYFLPICVALIFTRRGDATEPQCHSLYCELYMLRTLRCSTSNPMPAVQMLPYVFSSLSSLCPETAMPSTGHARNSTHISCCLAAPVDEGAFSTAKSRIPSDTRQTNARERDHRGATSSLHTHIPPKASSDGYHRRWHPTGVSSTPLTADSSLKESIENVYLYRIYEVYEVGTVARGVFNQLLGRETDASSALSLTQGSTMKRT